MLDFKYKCEYCSKFLIKNKFSFLLSDINNDCYICNNHPYTLFYSELDPKFEFMSEDPPFIYSVSWTSNNIKCCVNLYKEKTFIYEIYNSDLFFAKILFEINSKNVITPDNFDKRINTILNFMS